MLILYRVKCELRDVIYTLLGDGLCYAELFLYSIGNREICRTFSAEVLYYGDMQKIFYLISSYANNGDVND